MLENEMNESTPPSKLNVKGYLGMDVKDEIGSLNALF